jgi:hypothetical protein
METHWPMPPMETFSNRSTPFGDMIRRMSPTIRVASALLAGLTPTSTWSATALVNAMPAMSAVVASNTHRLKEPIHPPLPSIDANAGVCRRAAPPRNKSLIGPVYEKMSG